MRDIEPKQLVEITTVDRPRRIIEARLRDRGIIYIPIANVPTLFRWPKTGEYWIVRKEGGQWVLIESTDPAVTMRTGEDPEEKAIRIEEMNEGEVRLIATPNEDGSGVWINRHQAIRKASFTIGEAKEFSLEHKLETEHVSVSIFEKDGEDLDYPKVTIVDQNTIHLAFSKLLSNEAARVIISG